MDAYPPEYTDHNLPLIILSGLGAKTEEELPASHALLREGGFPINGHLPLVTGERAEHLLNDFLQADGSSAPWNARSARGNNGLMGFRFRSIGREFKLPPKKASPPPDHFPEDGASRSQSWVLHSPISPLSPIAPTFPDGIMTPLWVAKHQIYAPSVFISFFSFTSDPNLNSLNDNQLKSEINSIGGMLQNSDYKTRYAVVLLSDKTILEAPDIEERLAVIRRATGLDPKNSLFFLPPNTSRVEVSTFVHSVLMALQPACVEYYRDLTKHARRKKARGTIPPPTAPPMTGRSQTLHSEGWAVRYEFKLGVLAEFRQEMDAACRHYTTAQDILLGDDGVFRSTPSWSPRWDEARLLADAIALRIIRGLIWNNLPTHAVRSWLNYRNRIRRILDECGKGATNYGWEAWQSRWAKIMAELIQRANVPIFSLPSSKQARTMEREISLHVPAEKAIQYGERLNPWTLLHHPGYWLRISASYAVSRRLLAENLPEEDRVAPALASASQLSNRAHVYDSYLCPEPHAEFPLPGNEGFNHANDIVAKFNEAIREFSGRGQKRLADKVSLDIGKELMDAGRFDEAQDILKPLWTSMSWRSEGWWPHVSEVSSYLHDCATQLKDAEVLLATEWELLHRDLGVRPGYTYDLMKCLDIYSADSVDFTEKPKVQLQGDQVTSFLSVGCTLHGRTGHVGEPMKGQIHVSSKAHAGTSPVELSTVAIQFDGNLNRITLRHEDNTSASNHGHISCLSSISLKEEPDSTSAKLIFGGSSDLTIHPGQTKVFEFVIILREAGEVQATSSFASVSTDRFDISCTTSLTEEPKTSPWFLKGSGGIRATRLSKEDGTSIHIEPKPPKIQLRLPNLRDQYYTDERIALDIQILNEEEDESDVSLEVQILGASGAAFEYKWRSAAGSDGEDDHETSSDVAAQHPVGKLSPGATHTESVEFSATSTTSELSVAIKASYHLISDPETPIEQELKATLVILSPFEANYDFQPRLHPDPWPNFFNVDELESEINQSDSGNDSVSAKGISQKWLLAARIASVADEALIVSDAELVLHNVTGGATCSISKATPSGPIDSTVEARGLDERTFLVDVRKISLEDRRSSALEVSLRITWRRPDGPEQPGVASTITMPRLMIPSSEPRVLATCKPSAGISGLLHLDYTIENPTLHFLTFDLTMEASDEFAFSGRKYGALQVLPVSRQHVSYKLLPLVRGQWVSPQLRVVDRYFNKTLRVLSADGTRQDKKDILVWVDVPEENPE